MVHIKTEDDRMTYTPDWGFILTYKYGLNKLHFTSRLTVKTTNCTSFVMLSEMNNSECSTQFRDHSIKWLFNLVHCQTWSILKEARPGRSVVCRAVYVTAHTLWCKSWLPSQKGQRLFAHVHRQSCNLYLLQDISQPDVEPLNQKARKHTYNVSFEGHSAHMEEELWPALLVWHL